MGFFLLRFRMEHKPTLITSINEHVYFFKESIHEKYGIQNY